MKSGFTKLPIDGILVRNRKREAGDVSDLADSIAALGLLNPITVVDPEGVGEVAGSPGGPELVAGLRRLEACRQLGWTEIECNVVDLAYLDIEFVEIDENLCRLELTALQRVEQLERSEFLYRHDSGEKIHTASSGEQPAGFAQHASKTAGQSKRSIKQYLSIAEGIPKPLRDELRGTEAEGNLSELLALAREKNAGIQKRAVKRYKAGKVKSIREALGAEPKPITQGQLGRRLDALADWVRQHPNAEAGIELLKSFKRDGIPVGKLLRRLR